MNPADLHDVACGPAWWHLGIEKLSVLNLDGLRIAADVP